jgi:hypothetical protein
MFRFDKYLASCTRDVRRNTCCSCSSIVVAVAVVAADVVVVVAIVISAVEEEEVVVVFSNQLVNLATSSPADDVHHYVIPPKLLLTNRVYFQQTSGIHAPVGKRKGGSLSDRSPAPVANSFNVATTARKHRVLNLQEINRNNTHTALDSV